MRTFHSKKKIDKTFIIDYGAFGKCVKMTYFKTNFLKFMLILRPEIVMLSKIWHNKKHYMLSH
ncbi:hypothetical protein MCOL2_15672 [Listeria fleischmannii FSL S10-1203]|uniref:Uncharacterized protein n=1 Tax=Listeria fleischmannii FSL S10-1203 TaxID=1265822 RepID=W7DAH0_9LIST|nr:hypothetical protein MCOL2_15672 [Listeria fleischmannii FSL S10-1203]